MNATKINRIPNAIVALLLSNSQKDREKKRQKRQKERERKRKKEIITNRNINEEEHSY